MNYKRLPVKVELPAGVRCAVALSYDLEMCGGYAPDGINHGRIIPAVQEYALRLCETAERYKAKLHFFYVCNGLEEPDIRYLQEIVRRGHVLDNHTYSHKPVAVNSAEFMDHELWRANRMLKDCLGVTSTVLRGPVGYSHGWLNLPHANRLVILRNGFRWVTGEYDEDAFTRDRAYAVRAAENHQPYAYPEGLIEIPIQGWTDRMWFDMRPEVNQAVLDEWRKQHGHQPVPKGWHAPWTDEHALDEWIALNLDALDYAYENRLLWVPCWHPISHYLHDPENRMLSTLFAHAAAKKERVWVCTVRDAAAILSIVKQ
jgi:peptidoglycan/xylan/chitin deacetylase (PgdA/CDA1 family)